MQSCIVIIIDLSAIIIDVIIEIIIEIIIDVIIGGNDIMEKTKERNNTRVKRQNEKQKEIFDRVSAAVPKGTVDRIKKFGISVNFAVNEALSLYLEAIEEAEQEEMLQNDQGQTVINLDEFEVVGWTQEEDQEQEEGEQAFLSEPVETSAWALPEKVKTESENPVTAASIMEEFNGLKEKMQREKEDKERAKQEEKEEATRQYIEQLKKIRENGTEPENQIRLADF